MATVNVNGGVTWPQTTDEGWKNLNETSKSPLAKQPGGNHYKNLAIQPVEYITKNKLGYLEGNVIKYITRYKDKNGKEDLAKAKHYIELLEHYYDEA